MIEIISSAGLLLTLTTFLFNLSWPRVRDSLDQEPSVNGPKARESALRKVKSTLLAVMLPLFFAFSVLFYIYLPTAIGIIRSSDLAFWGFDVSRTLFVFIDIALFFFVVVVGSICYKLIIKVRSLKKE